MDKPIAKIVKKTHGNGLIIYQVMQFNMAYDCYMPYEFEGGYTESLEKARITRDMLLSTGVVKEEDIE